MTEDPVVEKVQTIRQAMLAKHRGDLHPLVQAAELFTIDSAIMAEPFTLKDLGEE